MNQVHLNPNPKISEFKIDSGLDGSVASPPMTLLDHSVDEFPRAYWTYSPRDQNKNHSFHDRTVMNWGPCHDNKIEVLLFQRPSQKIGTEEDMIWVILWTNMKSVKVNKKWCCRSYILNNLKNHFANKKSSHETSMSKKTHDFVQFWRVMILMVIPIPCLKRETRFWTRRQWRPKNRTTKVSGLSLMWS